MGLIIGGSISTVQLAQDNTADIEVKRPVHTNPHIFQYDLIWEYNHAFKRRYLFKDRHLRLYKNQPVGKPPYETIEALAHIPENAAEMRVEVIDDPRGCDVEE